MKTISLYQRRLLAMPWQGEAKEVFKLLHQIDEIIDDSNRVDKIDEQIILFCDQTEKWVGREIVGFDNSLDHLENIKVMDFSPVQAEREVIKIDHLEKLEKVFHPKSDFRYIRGKLDISGEICLDYFNSF